MAQKNDDLAKLIAMLGKSSPSQSPPQKAVAREVSRFHDPLPVPSNPIIPLKENTVDPHGHTVLSQDKDERRLVDASAPGTVLGVPKAKNGGIKKDDKENAKDVGKENHGHKQLFTDIDDDYIRPFLIKMRDEFTSLGIFNVNYTLRFEGRALSASAIDFLDADFKMIEGLSENKQFSTNMLKSLNVRLARVKEGYLIPLMKIGSDIIENELSFYVQSTKIPLDLNEEFEVRAPSVKMTVTESGKNGEFSPANATWPEPMKLGEFVYIQDNDGYKLPYKGEEYLIKLENEDDFRLTISITKMKSGSQETAELVRCRFNKISKINDIQELGLELELKQKGGKWAICLNEFDAYQKHKSMIEAQIALENSSKRIATTIVTLGAAASVLFLPQISSIFRDSLNLIQLPDTIVGNLPIIGEFKISLYPYISVAASSIVGIGAMFMGIFNNNKKK